MCIIYGTENRSNYDNPVLVETIGLRHQHLAHLSAAGITIVVDHGVDEEVKLKPNNHKHDNTSCVLGKGHRTVIPQKTQSFIDDNGVNSG